jgi:acyl carrier protein phosphodiesterase
MNYLAHIYLSGEDEKTLVGNFIGDYIKGKKIENYSKDIQKGILLHRHIDTFTDSHFKFLEAKKLFRAEFGLYSGIMIDFFFDHFLASNWNLYSTLTLRNFSKRTHAILLSNFLNLPTRVQGFLPFLIQNRRLESYASVDGIIQSIEIMSKYTSLPAKSEIAKKILLANYDYLSKIFEEFMVEMLEFVRQNHQISIVKPE